MTQPGSPGVDAGGSAVPPPAVAATAGASASSSSASAGASAPTGGGLPSHHVPNPGLFGPKFRNPWDTYELKSFGEVMKWQRQRKKDAEKAGIDMEGHLLKTKKPTAEDWSRAFPLNAVGMAALASPDPSAIQAVWVGHACVLVQMGGATFVTDPVLSERCSPFQFMGPKRFVAPALTFKEPDLPPLDFVLISHNHYDHLDTGSVRTLFRRYGKALRWYVPLGIKDWFAGEGITNVVEMDWWQTANHELPSGKSVEVMMVPAQHWGARGVLDRLRTLWGGFVVTASLPQPAGWQHSDGAATGDPCRRRFYFVGDTGYCPVFKEIGTRLGHIDLAAVPIGAYAPRWFMKAQHVDVDEAVSIAQDVRATTCLAIHHATWCLTDEAMDEPATRLPEVLAERGLPPRSFLAVQHGEMMVVKGGSLQGQPRTLPVAANNNK